ncbi:MAG: PAS domain S-box protein [Bacteroidales bacterium]
MGFREFSLIRKINVVIALFILMNLTAMFYAVSFLDPDVVFQQITRLILVGAGWIVMLVLIVRFLYGYVVTPLKKVREVAELASVGDLSSKVEYEQGDEIGQIAFSIDRIIQNQLNLAEFAEQIGEGNFKVDYEVLSHKDKLGTSITGMRDKLQIVASEDMKRNWTSEGLTRFNEILRDVSDDLQVASDRLLSQLIKQLDANQGFIFLINNEEEGRSYLELVSAYAWERKKYLTKAIEIGEGLVGQAAIEKNTIFLADVPEDYVNITSGLGDANPRSLLIVPMIYNNEIFGVIELASFKVYEGYVVEFVEKLAEIIASSISRVRVSEQTQKLLRESQKLTEEMKSQEEEMRQNLEEMNATQEEMQLREVERIGIFSAINNTLATVEFDMEGKIIDANENFLNLMRYSIDDIEHKTDRMFADQANEPIEEYKAFWKSLREGKLMKGDFKRLTKDGREIWINASYTPALDKDGKPYKVIELAQDITEKKKAELESRRQAEELKVQGEKLKSYTSELEDIKQNLSEKLEEASQGLKKKIKDIEAEKAKNVAVLEGCVDGVVSFNHQGVIEFFNNAAEEIWSIRREEVLGKPVDAIIPLTLEADKSDVRAYLNNEEEKKEIGIRTEITIPDKAGSEMDLLLTLTRAKVDQDYTFTLFAQKISVDLF